MKIALIIFVIFGCNNSFAAIYPQKVALLKKDLEKKLRIEKTNEAIKSTTTTVYFDQNEREDALNEKRAVLIKELISAIKTSKSKNTQITLSLKLAILFVEDYYSKLRRHSDEFKPKTSLETSESSFQASVTRSLSKARNVLKHLLKYTNHPEADKILYLYATLSVDQNLDEEYVKYFTLLIQKFPNSPLSTDAYLQLGDHYFDKHDFKQALSYYDKVIEKKGSSLSAYAEYKKAWLLYNLGKMELAFNIFKKLAIFYQTSSKNMERIISKEALCDIIYPLAELGDIKKAISFFENIEDELQRQLINKLALMFKEKGLYNKAIVLWEELLQKSDTHPENPFYEIEVLNSLILSNKPSTVLSRLENNLSIYISPEYRWNEENKSNKEHLKKVLDSFESLIKKYATELHSLAQKTRGKSYYELAKSFYRVYLSFFDYYADSDKIRFALAEIEYKDKEFESAKNNYLIVFKNNSQHKKSSLLGMLVSLVNLLNKERQDKGLINISINTSDKIFALGEKEAYTEIENEFLEFAQNYINLFPKDEKTADILYEKAYLHYLHSDAERAQETFWTLISSFPEKAITYSAVHLLMDIYNKKFDYEGLVRVCNALLEKEVLKNDKLRTEVLDILRRSELKIVEALEKRNDYLKAANAYMSYTIRYGYSDESLFEKALYNASVNYEKAGDYIDAIRAQEKLLSLFPKTKLKKFVFKNIAANYALVSNYEKAAEYYEKFATFFVNDAFSEKALRLSATYYAGIGEISRSVNIIKKLMSRSPHMFEILEDDLIKLYTMSGKKEALISYYKNALAEKNLKPMDFLSYTYALYELKGQNIPQKVWNELIKVSKTNRRKLIKTNKGRELLSKTLFIDVEKRESPFFSITLKYNDKEPEKKVQKKFTLLKDLEKDYFEIVALGESTWSMAATYKLAILYKEMLDFVNNSNPPSNLNPTELEYYKKEIQKIFVEPIYAKLESILEKCVKLSGETLSISIWPNLCHSMAMKITPKKYPPIRIVLLPPVELTIILPNKENDIQMSHVPTFNYPFYQSFLFELPEKVKTISRKNPLIAKYELVPDLFKVGSSLYFYDGLKKKRINDVKILLRRLRPKNGEEPSFAYLNTLRVVKPLEAIKLIRKNIEKYPKSTALHNLLGITFLELGNINAANMVWLSMLAHGFEDGGIYNNLGVLQILNHDEKLALNYFSEATKLNVLEAYKNLGFMYLKYNYSPFAEEEFHLALKNNTGDTTAKIGLFASLLQNRDFDMARNKLYSISELKHDPYARLLASYFLIDVEKDFQMAKTIISGYLKEQPEDMNKLPFKKAYNESAKASAILAIPMLGLPSMDE